MDNTGLVLVVDDNLMNRTLLATNLKETGYRVEMAEDGQQALDMLHKQPFDAILLDLVMPGMDGYALMSHIRDDDTFRHIPIIVISIMDKVETIAECIELGATDYLPKPFNPILLQARLSSSLARKRLQDAERAHLRELQVRNEELDAFAATLAHDLKSPMSGIDGFANLALAQLEDTPPEQIRSLLEHITGIVGRVEEMIQGLLLLARVPTTEVSIEPVSTALMIYGVKIRLKHALQESGAELVVASDWPDALGHEPWLEEVWANYIGNAVKYGGRPPRIELGHTMQPNGLIRFWVRDNGNGVAKHDIGQLFKPFSRIGGTRQKGHGLGLSIVKRIVDKLGGQVGVDSEVDHGSTFWFELPEAPPDDD